MKSLLEAAKSDDDEKIGENDEAKKEFEDIVVDVSSTKVMKFIYSEKATKFCKIIILLLTTVHIVKSKVNISQNFVAFSEYMNFI